MRENTSGRRNHHSVGGRLQKRSGATVLAAATLGVIAMAIPSPALAAGPAGATHSHRQLADVGPVRVDDSVTVQHGSGPSRPGTPGKPSKPSKPGTPGTPGKPGGPSEPGTPGKPSRP